MTVCLAEVRRYRIDDAEPRLKFLDASLQRWEVSLQAYVALGFIRVPLNSVNDVDARNVRARGIEARADRVSAASSSADKITTLPGDAVARSARLAKVGHARIVPRSRE